MSDLPNSPAIVPQAKEPQYALNRRLGGQSQSGHMVKEKFTDLAGIQILFFQCVA